MNNSNTGKYQWMLLGVRIAIKSPSKDYSMTESNVKTVNLMSNFSFKIFLYLRTTFVGFM